MIKIAVCDDEEYFRKLIATYLKEYMKTKADTYEIDIFESGRQLIDIGIKVMQYKIVFLDINMDGMNGIETAKILRSYSQDAFLVLITAFMDYTLEGYKVEAFRYILKRKVHMKESIKESLDSIFKKLDNDVKKIKFDFIEGELETTLDRIVYIESKLHKLEFHVMKEKEFIYTMYEKLDAIEAKLTGQKFIRLHQSFFVNMKHIQRLERYMVTMDNKAEIIVPRARYKMVSDAFIAYKGEL